MLGAATLLLGLLSTVGADPDVPAVAAPAFREWFDAAAQGTLRVPAAVAQQAATYRYIFVGGFANERMPGYFAQSERALRARGVPRRAIHFIFPSSHRPFDDNCDGVAKKFLEIAAAGPEPLVIIGHSRGASDALAFALRHPDFVQARVHALFLVQGAFGGTGAADYVLGEGTPMDRQMPLRLRVLAHVLGRAEQLLLRQGKHEGLSDLTRQGCSAFWERTLADCRSAIPIVGPRTFFVTSQVEPARLRLFRRAIATYLQTYYGPNDGMVLLEDQSLPGVGTRLEVRDAAHTELTHRVPGGRASRRLRTALVDSIVMAVGQAGRRADGEHSEPAPVIPRAGRRRNRPAAADEAARAAFRPSAVH